MEDIVNADSLIAKEDMDLMTPDDWRAYKDTVTNTEAEYTRAQAIIKGGANYSTLWRTHPVYLRPNGKVDVAQMARDFGVSHSRFYEWVKRKHPDAINANTRTPLAVRVRAS